MNRRRFLTSLLTGAALAVGASTGLGNVLGGGTQWKMLGPYKTPKTKLLYMQNSDFDLTTISVVGTPVNPACKVGVITNEPQFTRIFGRPS